MADRAFRVGRALGALWRLVSASVETDERKASFVAEKRPLDDNENGKRSGCRSDDPGHSVSEPMAMLDDRNFGQRGRRRRCAEGWVISVHPLDQFRDELG